MSRVFVGNLPMDIREEDLADLFLRYGRILGIDIKTPRNPPAYAFIDYDDNRSAEDAVRDRDGYDFAGERLRVEISRSGGRGGGGGGRGGGRERHGGPPGDNSVIVTGLPKSASWQDLKDHFRKVGHVVYTDVDRMGGGIVEFSNRHDADEAWRQMDGAEFSNPFDSVRISVHLPNTSYTDGGSSRDDYDRRDRHDRRDRYDDYDRRGRDDYDRRRDDDYDRRRDDDYDRRRDDEYSRRRDDDYDRRRDDDYDRRRDDDQDRRRDDDFDRRRDDRRSRSRDRDDDDRDRPQDSDDRGKEGFDEKQPTGEPVEVRRD